MTRADPGQVRLTIRPSRRVIGRQGGGVHLLVRAEPPAPPRRKVRRPVAMALVIDRSGSMGQAAVHQDAGPSGPSGLQALSGMWRPPQAGTGARGDTGRTDKLRFVKAATVRLVDMMHDGDAVALVTFDDQVTVAKPLTVLDDRSRRALRDAVGRLQPGGSTYLEGGFRAGLDQLGEAVREQYGCKLVLLSDGQANVGEQRPAVLSEAAAGAARGGVTTSTLGVGVEYNIALMSALAEAGNGDFTHIGSLETLDEVLREEFTTAAEVTARGVEVELGLPERVAFGTNLNGYRQGSTDRGFTVQLGDLVRPKEFLFEVTTPVSLDGGELVIAARATYQDTEGVGRESSARLALRVRDREEAERQPADEHVLEKLLVQLPARAEMDVALAYEAGDVATARALLEASRQSMADVRQRYGTAADNRVEMAAWRARLADLSATADAGPPPAAHLKTMFAAGYEQSRSRRPRSTM